MKFKVLNIKLPLAWFEEFERARRKVKMGRADFLIKILDLWLQ